MSITSQASQVAASAVLVAMAIVSPISATADVRGVHVHGDPKLVCHMMYTDNTQPSAEAELVIQEVSINEHTQWLSDRPRPRVGQDVVVQCWYPGTSGFAEVTTPVQGFTIVLPFAATP